MIIQTAAQSGTRADPSGSARPPGSVACPVPCWPCHISGSSKLLDCWVRACHPTCRDGDWADLKGFGRTTSVWQRATGNEPEAYSLVAKVSAAPNRTHGLADGYMAPGSLPWKSDPRHPSPWNLAYWQTLFTKQRHMAAGTTTIFTSVFVPYLPSQTTVRATGSSSWPAGHARKLLTPPQLLSAPVAPLRSAHVLVAVFAALMAAAAAGEGCGSRFEDHRNARARADHRQVHTALVDAAVDGEPGHPR